MGPGRDQQDGQRIQVLAALGPNRDHDAAKNHQKSEHSDAVGHERAEEPLAIVDSLGRRFLLLLAALLEFSHLPGMFLIFRIFGIAQITQQQFLRPFEVIFGMDPNRPPILLGLDQIRDALQVEKVAERRRARFTGQMTDHPHNFKPISRGYWNCAACAK